MSQILQNIAKFQKFKLENLVDFEKCCKTHIFLQKSEPIHPKTSNILPKFCQPTLSDDSAASLDHRGQRVHARLDARRLHVLEELLGQRHVGDVAASFDEMGEYLCCF